MKTNTVVNKKPKSTRNQKPCIIPKLEKKYSNHCNDKRTKFS